MLAMGDLLTALADGKNMKKLYSALGRNNIQGRKKWNCIQGRNELYSGQEGIVFCIIFLSISQIRETHGAKDTHQRGNP